MLRELRWAFAVRRYGGAEAARRLGATVGNGCRIYSASFANEPWLVTIGSRVTISSEVLFITHDGATWLAEDGDGRRERFAPIRIGDSYFIGARSTIMPGVEIGDRCIVAAGTVVHRSVPSGTVVAGNPARIIGSYDDYISKSLRLRPKRSNRSGVRRQDQINSIVDETPLPPLIGG